MSEDNYFELEDEQQIIDYIKNYLPQESKDKFDEDDLVYILDLIMEYYENQNNLTDDPENDEYLLVDQDEMVKFILKESKKDEMGPYAAEDLLFVIQGEMEFANQCYDEENN